MPLPESTLCVCGVCGGHCNLKNWRTRCRSPHHHHHARVCSERIKFKAGPKARCYNKHKCRHTNSLTRSHRYQASESIIPLSSTSMSVTPDVSTWPSTLSWPPRTGIIPSSSDVGVCVVLRCVEYERIIRPIKMQGALARAPIHHKAGQTHCTRSRSRRGA